MSSRGLLQALLELLRCALEGAHPLVEDAELIRSLKKSAVVRRNDDAAGLTVEE